MTKRIVLFVILMLSALMSVGISMAQSTSSTGTVTASALNVRSEPSTSARIIATVRQGYTAGVIGKNSDASWYQILITGGFGWVNAGYLTVTNANTVPVTWVNATPTPVPPQPVVAGGLVNTGALNIRTVPSPFNNVPIKYVLRNTALTITGRTADSSWIKVVAPDNTQGWVNAKYVSVTSGNINSLPIEGQAQTASAQGYVNTGALHIRTVPSPFNNVPIRYFVRNTKMSIIGRTSDSEWYQVNVNGTTGWMRGKYIAVTSGNIANLPITG